MKGRSLSAKNGFPSDTESPPDAGYSFSTAAQPSATKPKTVNTATTDVELIGKLPRRNLTLRLDISDEHTSGNCSLF